MPGRSSVIARRAFTNLSRKRWQAAAADQRPELRPLQDLRHQGPDPEHQLGHARRRRRTQLPEHVSAERCGRCRVAGRWRAGRGARPGASADPALIYLQARAASIDRRPCPLGALAGDVGRGAAGQIDHRAQGAVRGDQRRPDGSCAAAGARRIPANRLTSDARAAARRRGAAAATGAPGASVAPRPGRERRRSSSWRRWSPPGRHAERGDIDRALDTIEQIPPAACSARSRAEQQALILLKFRRTAEAEPFARRAVGASGAREARLRLAFADGFLAAGDQAARARDPRGAGHGGRSGARARSWRASQAARRSIRRPRRMSEVLTAFAADVARLERGPLPIGLVQVARYANPGQHAARRCCSPCCSTATARPARRSTVLRSVGPGDALVAQARDIQVRILTDEKRLNEAYSVAGAGRARRQSDGRRLVAPRRRLPFDEALRRSRPRPMAGRSRWPAARA